MKKKLIIIISIILVIALITVLTIILLNKNVNYNYMKEDMESIKKHQIIIHAKQTNNNNNVPVIYEGEGYYIEVWRGGDVVDYKIYVNKKNIWNYSKVYPEEAR